MLVREGSTLPAAAQLREGTLTLGEGFSFMSSLYFRGRLTYARAFSRSSATCHSPVLIITPTRGLQPSEMMLTRSAIEEFASVDLATGGERYRAPLEQDLMALSRDLSPEGRAILLGSVATAKYVGPVLDHLGGVSSIRPHSSAAAT